jgi:hypothetical protein
MTILVVVAVMWFLPFVIVMARRSDSAISIVILNLVVGWLPLVSLGCLIWAIVDKTEKKQQAHAKMLAEAIVTAQRS